MTYKNFWDFYLANRKYADEVLDYHCNKYKNSVDVKDLRQEVLLRIAQSNFLDKWDSKRASLITFFSVRVGSYASHVFETMTYKPTMSGSVHGTVPGRKGYEAVQVYFPDLNKNVASSHEVLSINSTPYDSALTQDMLALARTTLAKRVIAYYAFGHSYDTIAERCGVSRAVVIKEVHGFKTRLIHERELQHV